MSSLAMTLIHFIWQAALIALSLKLVLFISKKQSLKLRYYSSVLALSACFIWPCYTFNSVYHQHDSQMGQNSVKTSDTETLLSFGETFTQENIISSNLFSGSPDFLSFDFQWLVILWFAGVALMTAKFIYDLGQTYRLTREGVSPVEAEIITIVSQICKRFNIKRRVTILKSNLVNVPVVIGWFKPTVLLPIAIFIGLDRQQLELILAHELAHIKRLDFLVNLVQGLIQVLFFYHPCVYWMNKVLREEREYICDSMALAAFQNDPTSRLELAKALLNIEELKEGNLPLVAVAASDGHLKNRISRIVLNEKLRLPSARGVLVVLMGMIFSLTTIAVTSDMSANIKKNQDDYSQRIAIVAGEESLDSLPLNLLSVQNENKEQDVEVMVSSKSNLRQTNQFSDERNKLVSSTIKKEANPLSSNSNLKSKEKNESLSDDFELMSSNKIQLSTQKIAMENVQLSNPVKPVELKSKPVKQNPQNQTLAEVTDIPVFNDANFVTNDTIVADLTVQPPQIKIALLDAKKKTQFVAPKALETPYPIYPSGAFRNNLSGRVKVEFVIDERGYVVNPQFTEGTPWIFLKEIKSKLRKWRYKPAVKNGEKIAYSSSVFFDFELPEDEPLYQYQVGSRIKRRFH